MGSGVLYAFTLELAISGHTVINQVYNLDQVPVYASLALSAPCSIARRDVAMTPDTTGHPERKNAFGRDKYACATAPPGTQHVITDHGHEHCLKCRLKNALSLLSGRTRRTECDTKNQTEGFIVEAYKRIK